MAKIANPQGKGNHLLNNHWYPVIKLQDKSERVILSDYLLSSLVLSAEFLFKPVPDTDYYLYLWKGVLRLSLIPAEKCQIVDVEALALCQLKADLTWQVSFVPKLSETSIDFLKQFAQRFSDHMNQDKSMAELLPVYEESLPFYRRLYASGLAKSLGISMKSRNMLELTSKQALKSVSEYGLLPGKSA